MKWIILLVMAVIGLSGCAMLPQMQNWSTKDQIAGGLFIAECLWDGYETNKFINHQKHIKQYNNPDGSVTTIVHRDREANSFVRNRTQALVWGISGMYFVLKGADILPEIRSGWLIGGCIMQWGGARHRWNQW